MSLEPNHARKKSSVHPYPQGCGFPLLKKDLHKTCPICLGIVHARRALTEPVSCALPVSAGGLFGQSLNAIQMKFEVRKKHAEALSSIIPA